MNGIDAHLGRDQHWPGPALPVSIIILSHNEEANIAPCLRSCAWSDDVHVLDSGSTDRTRDIAAEMGAKVHINPFVSFGQQRNWAIDHIPCKHPWHFHLDSDERFTLELVQEMASVIRRTDVTADPCAYRVAGKMIFLNRWIKHSSGYPAYQVRFFRHGRLRFVDHGHGQRESCDGPVGTLVNPYVHYGFSKGLESWFYKHNSYSTREAMEGMEIRKHGWPSLGELLSSDRTTRRRSFKNLSFLLRGRSAWRFGHDYFWKLGLLDGFAGFHYCAMISMYEYWTGLKMHEEQRRWSPETLRVAAELMREGKA